MIRQIIIWPDSVLRRKCEKVETIDEDVKRLLEDMATTMIAAKGVGLAAPQIGFALRLVTILVRHKKPAEGEKSFEVLKLVNPVITSRRGYETKKEGCLSLPGHYELIRRSSWVEVEATDENGQRITVVGDGPLAQGLQHEIEHLDGRMFVDHLPPIRRDSIAARFKKAKAKGMRYPEDRPEPRDFTVLEPHL